MEEYRNSQPESCFYEYMHIMNAINYTKLFENKIFGFGLVCDEQQPNTTFQAGVQRLICHKRSCNEKRTSLDKRMTSLSYFWEKMSGIRSFQDRKWIIPEIKHNCMFLDAVLLTFTAAGSSDSSTNVPVYLLKIALWSSRSRMQLCYSWQI